MRQASTSCPHVYNIFEVISIIAFMVVKRTCLRFVKIVAEEYGVMRIIFGGHVLSKTFAWQHLFKRAGRCYGW